MHKTIAKVASIAMLLGMASPALAFENPFHHMTGITNTATVQDNNVSVSANTGNNAQLGTSMTDLSVLGGPILSLSPMHHDDHQQQPAPSVIQGIGSSVDQLLQTGDALAQGQSQIVVNTIEPSWMSMLNTATVKYNDVNAAANTGFNVQTGMATTGVTGGGTGTVQSIGSGVSQGMLTGGAGATGSLWVFANAPSLSIAQ